MSYIPGAQQSNEIFSVQLTPEAKALKPEIRSLIQMSYSPGAHQANESSSVPLTPGR